MKLMVSLLILFYLLFIGFNVVFFNITKLKTSTKLRNNISSNDFDFEDPIELETNSEELQLFKGFV